MSRWPLIALGELLCQRLEEYRIADASKETFVTVRLYGKGLVRREVAQGKTPVMRNGYQLVAGDLVYSRIDARNGAFAIVPPELGGAVVSKDFPCFAIRRDLVHPSFLIRILGNEYFYGQLRAASFGTTNRQRIAEKALLSCEIALPPLPEQERIVCILDEADALRRLRAQAGEGTRKLLWALFRDMFGTEEFRRVPLGDLTSLVTSGVTPRGGEGVYVTEGPYFIRSQNVQMNRLDLSNAACLPADIHTQMMRTKIADGDVLLNITGASIGRVTWVGVLDREANISQHVCLIRPKTGLVNPVYLSVFISMPETQHLILQVQAGASRQALNHQQVRGLEIPLPPVTRQRAFAARVAEIRELEEKQAASRQCLDDLFQSLLHCAFQGEL